MDIGVLTVPLGDRSIEEAFSYLDGIGVDAVELGAGGYPGRDTDHFDREAYLDDEDRQQELHDLLEEYDLRISALASHNLSLIHI